VNHSTEGIQEFADLGAYLTLTGLGTYIYRDTLDGHYLCTIPAPHQTILPEFRVCACEECFARRNVVYTQSAWSVTREARAYAYYIMYEEC